MNVYRSVALTFVGALLWAACGSDSNGGGEDQVALCKQLCNKLVGCYDGGLPINCDTTCAPGDGGTGGGGTCTNESEIVAAYKACLDKPCDQLNACFEKIPDCQGGGATGTGGAGGSTGGAGGTGGGGTGGGGADSGTATCNDFLACCNRASTDALKMQCMTVYDGIKASGDQACAVALSTFKSTYCP